MKARLADLGAAPFAGSPAEFGKLIAEDTEKWGKVVNSPASSRTERNLAQYSILSVPRTADLVFIMSAVAASNSETRSFARFRSR